MKRILSMIVALSILASSLASADPATPTDLEEIRTETEQSAETDEEEITEEEELRDMQEDAQEPEEADELSGYVRVKAGTAAYADEALTEEAGTFTGESVVYAFTAEESGVRKEKVTAILFAANGEAVHAYVRTSALAACEEGYQPVVSVTSGKIALEDAAYTAAAQNVTEEQEVTEEPEATEEPAVTEEPEATEEPAVTEEPEATEEPAATEEPETAEEAVAAEEPEVTEEPAPAEATAESEAPATVTDLTEEKPAAETAAAPAEEEKTAATATDLPEEVEARGSFFTMSEQITSNSVQLKWNSVAGAASYVVSYTDLKGKVKTSTVKVTCTVIKSLSAGTYVFSVYPCSDKRGKTPLSDEVYTAGVTVGDWSWSNATTVSAKQLTATEAVTRVTWTVNADADGYEISDNKKTVLANVDGADRLDVSLTTGTHSIYCRPYRYAQDGSKIYGTYSKKAAKVTIKIAWMTAKTAVTCAQTDEDEITLTWKAIENADGYYVYQVAGKTMQQVCKVSGATTALVDGLAYGKYTFAVQPYRMNSLGTEDLGTLVKSKVLTTKVLWSQASTIVSVCETAANKAEIVWTSPKQSSVYRVYEGTGKTRTLLAEVTGSMSYETDPDKYPLTVGKSYKFTVVPVQVDANGKKTEGTASKAYTLKMIEGWKVAPRLSAVQTYANAVTLLWTVAAPADTYTIYRVNGKKTVKVKEVNTADLDMYGNAYMCLIDGLTYGSVSFLVEPGVYNAKGRRTAGNKSAAATVVIGEFNPWVVEDGVLVAYNSFEEILEIPENVTAIGPGVFSGMTQLLQVDLGDHVTEIGEGAFSGCTALKNVYGTGALKTIGSAAFASCTSLDYAFAETVENVSGDAFSGIVDEEHTDWLKAHELKAELGGLGKVTLTWTEENTSAVVEISELNADGTYTVLAEVPGTQDSYEMAGVSEGDHTYAIRAGLRCANGRQTWGEYGTVTVTVSLSDFTEDDVTYHIDGKSLTVVKYNGTARQVTIPESIEGFTVIAIGPNAFEGNTTLESVDLPDSVEVIDDYAFADCTSLYEIN